jgi:gliding motility-associated-like protein
MGEISSYKWELLDPFGSLSTPNQKSTDFTISPSYQGAFPASLRVLLTVADKEGNLDKDTLMVTIDPPASAEISSSGKYEKDGSMLIDGSVSIGNGLQYRWFTNEGKIIGDNTKAVVMLNGTGIYNLEVTDAHGCKSLKSFQFPIPTTSILANNDYARTSWDQPVTIPVLENDFDPNHDLKTDILSIFEKPVRGDAATNPDGTITYKNNENQSGSDQFIYQICDSEGRCATAKVKVVIEAAGVQPTEAFSPNGDNQNDYLVFKGLENYPNSQLYIYTRGGQLVYSDPNYQNNWDGKRKINNQVVPTGTYYYILKLGGTGKTIKGFVFIDY